MDLQIECVPTNSDCPEFLPGYPDINSYSQNLLKATLNSIKLSNKIPSSGENFNFYHSFPGFRQLMRTERKQILDLMTRILQHQCVKGTFEHVEIEEKFDFLVDANDSILERVGTALDDASGIKKKEEAVVTTIKFVKPINTSWNKMASRNTSVSLLAAKNVARPQLKFTKKINNSNSPFEPSITFKPHSIKPLSILLEVNSEGHEMFSHPYEIEIEKFQPSESTLQKVIPQVPKSFEDTPFDFIDTLPDLMKFCESLSHESEIAVDLEAHSYRTFQGFTCLMQISTRTRDAVIDVLELRDHMHNINEIFTNPAIIKVFHGADMDVVWLQRDFGVYLVNLFDTGQAARVLNYSHFGLAYLLKRFCQVDPDKSFQLADWRIRPLTENMVHYAREDTHHLLYVFDCLKNELLDQGNEHKNLLHSVYQRSKLICLKRYEKPMVSDDTYLNIYHKSKKTFNTRQLFALKELYMWREKIARTEDESYGYVLPNHMILQIAEILPREQQGILACCNPIPPLVRQQLNELHLIILKAREWSEEKLMVPKSHLKLSVSQIQSQVHRETSLCCPHDLPPQEINSLPTILDDCADAKTSNSIIIKSTPDLIAFETIGNDIQSHKNDERLIKVELHLKKIISPFQRFQLAEKTELATTSTLEKELGDNCEHIERVHQHFQTLVTTKVKKSSEQEKVEKDSNVSQLTEKTIPEDKSKLEPEESISLRNQIPRKRKRKSERPIPDIPLSMFTTKIQNPPAIPEKVFTPYDYKSSTSFSLDQRSNNQQAKKRPFDPNDTSCQEKKGKQSKRKRGGKNMTYGSKSQNLKKKQWPK